jgi:hypothetical protein
LPVPADLAPALGRQLDLSPVVSGTGITVYANADWIPARAEVPASGHGPATSVSAGPLASPPGSSLIPGAVPVLPGPVASRSYQGPLSVGTVFAAVAPADRWHLIGLTGATALPSPSFGWAARYRSPVAGTGTLRFDGGVTVGLSLLFSLLVWIAAVALLLGRRVAVPGRARRLRRGRHPSRSGRPGAESGDDDTATDAGSAAGADTDAVDGVTP